MSQAALDALTVFWVSFTSGTALHGVQVAPCFRQSPPITRAQRSQNNYRTSLLTIRYVDEVPSLRLSARGVIVVFNLKKPSAAERSRIRVRHGVIVSLAISIVLFYGHPSCMAGTFLSTDTRSIQIRSYRVARILGSNGNRDCTREFPNFWLRKSVLLILYHCIHINVNSVHPTAQGVSLDLSAPASLTSAQPFDGVHACRSRIQPGMDAWFRGKLVGYMHVIMQCFMPLPAFPHLSEHQARSGNATQHVLVSASREGEHATIRTYACALNVARELNCSLR